MSLLAGNFQKISQSYCSVTHLVWLFMTPWTAACQTSQSLTISRVCLSLCPLHRWSLSFSFSSSLCNQYSGLISFRTDWFYLTEVQGTLKSLFQCHNLKASILQHLDFFMVQLSHLHMTSGKTIDSTIQIFVGKVMSLLFNMLSRFVHCRWWLQPWN